MRALGQRDRRVGFVILALSGILLSLPLIFRSRDAVDASEGASVATNRTSLAAAAAPKGFPTDFCVHQKASRRSTAPYVVTLAEGASKIEAIKAVRDCGARVIGPMPPNALIVETSVFALGKISVNPHFAAAREWLPEDKVDARLKPLLEAEGGPIDVTVVALASADVAPLAEAVAAQGGERLKGCLDGKTSVTLRLPRSVAKDLLGRGDVRWLEPFVRPQLLNVAAVGPTTMNVREVWDAHGLKGRGQVVTTSDSGIDTGDLATMHLDLRNRVIGFAVADEDHCAAYDANGHGTHTAGSIVGDGTMSDGQIRGTAYGAKLWAWFCGDAYGNIYMPSSCADLFRPSGATNACVHSASWGSNDAGTYSSQSASMDEYVWEHPDFLPVIANGNVGSSAQTVGSPATAKNVLSVGATQNARSGGDGGWGNGDPTKIASFSSRGPCKDGRIKPDLCAPGVGVASTRAYGCSYDYGVLDNTNYAYDTGTSMATPLTAGAAAVVRQWLVERRGYTNAPPTAALVKAVLTGGAKGVSVPDNSFGWGRVDLGESLYPSNRAVRLIDRVPFGEGSASVYDVTLTNAAPFDVQLVWVDYPATAGAAVTLVNDLDLLVSNRTTGAVWCGNGLAGGDHTNNLESVRISSAEAGDYAVIVRGTTVWQTDGGAAALYLRGAFEGEAEAPDPGGLEIVSRTPSGGGVTVRAGTAAAFAATVAASEGLAYTWTWTLDGTNVTTVVSNEFTWTTSWADHGSHTLQVAVSAENGISDAHAWTVSVFGDVSVDAATGDDATATGEPNAPYATIAAALAASAKGDTLRVGSGTYAGGLVAPSGCVRIESVNGPAATVIDGGGTNRCFDGSACAETVLSGFTLTNGWASTGGGGALYGVLSNCVIRNCRAASGGGGACAATLHWCVIAECSTDGQGGGAYCSVLVNCTVRGCRADGWRDQYQSQFGCNCGGGIDLQCVCTNTIVWGNARSDGTLDNWEEYLFLYDWPIAVYRPMMSWCCTTPSTGSGENNITDDPKFVAADDIADARVYELSPCIGAGRDGANMGAYAGSGIVLGLPQIDVKTATGEEVSNAVAGVGYADAAVERGIGTNGATYAAFAVWSTNGLKSTAVVFSTRAWDSFCVRDLVAAPMLLAEGEETTVELTALEPASDGSCSTTVRLVDGDDPLPLCSAKAAFAAKTRVGTDPAALVPADPNAVAAESADEGKAVKLTITPPSAASCYFLRFVVW